LSTAERSPADALGVGWRRYTWIRDEIAGLLGDQRQREDARILMLELTRTRDDLKEQLAQVRDEASRQFLAAQLNSLDEKLAALDAERRVPQDEERELAVIEEARAELATLQGRQDRLQRSVRDLLQAARSRRATGATPPPARGTGVGRRGSGTVPPAR
jgi:chromosome segregation ATPase